MKYLSVIKLLKACKIKYLLLNMYTLNEVSSESSSDNDESVDEDFVDHASSSQSTHNQSTHQSSSQVEEMEITRSKRSLRSKPLGPYEGVPLSEYVKGDRMQLFCRSQQFLAIYPDGKVRGTSEKSDPHSKDIKYLFNCLHNSILK